MAACKATIEDGQEQLSGQALRRVRVEPRCIGERAWPLLLALVVAACNQMNPYFDPAKPHHRADGFVNSDGGTAGKSMGALLRWLWQRKRDGLPPPPARYLNGYAGFPVDRPDPAWLAANRTRTAVTWIGHATVLVQMSGLNILTDPHFSGRAAPVQWAGPERRVPLPMALVELPRIDLVLISHNHYDHLDRDTVLSLHAQPGGAPLFLVPLGVERWMRQQGIERVRAFDWWDSYPVGDAGVAITFVPAHHWSGRTPWDRNRTLWGGWVAKAPSFSLFFAGDTGYSTDFAEIGRRFGGFDLALLPVGAYEPRWFMGEQHVDPPQAVRIHEDLRAKQSIGIHWGTFELTDEPLDAPIGALPAARASAGLAPDAFVLLRHGQTRLFDR